MAALSFIQGAVDGVGKALATLQVTLTGGPSNLAHVELVQHSDGDDDQLHIPHVAAHTLQAVPTSIADVVSTLCKLRHAFFSNTHATAILTVTLQDKTGTPIKILDARPLAPGEVLSFPAGDMKCTGGLRWVASGAGIVGAVQAYTA